MRSRLACLLGAVAVLGIGSLALTAVAQAASVTASAAAKTCSTAYASTINYSWDEAAADLPTLASETNGSGGALRTYLYGASSSPVSMVTPGGSYYDSYDASGNVADLTDSSGAAQWAYSYEPFGLIRSATNVSGTAPTNPYQYAGQYTDAGTGLSDLRARNYDPNTGAFTSTDPAGQITTLASSPYAYAGDEPLLNSDPSGLWCWSLSWSCASQDLGEAAHYAYWYETGGGFQVLANAVNNYVVQPTVQAVQNDVSCVTSATQGSFSAGHCIEGAVATALVLLPEARVAFDVTAIAGGLAFRAAARTAGTELGQAATGSLFRLATEETGSFDAGAFIGRGEEAAAQGSEVPLSAAERSAAVGAADSFASEVSGAESEASQSSGRAAKEAPTLFRGTSEDFPGSPALQELGLTPASMDPAVAAVHGTFAEQFGAGVLHIASPADLAGVRLYPGNVLGGLESEVGVGITPTQFASRAGTTISSARARAILGGLGVDVPSAIYGGADVLSALRSMTPMTGDQIQAFLERAGGGG